jgi:hypothetical protein
VSSIYDRLSLDDPGRLKQHGWWDRESERAGGLEVDHQVESRGLLHWEVARAGSLQDLVDVHGGPPEVIRDARSIGG